MIWRKGVSRWCANRVAFCVNTSIQVSDGMIYHAMRVLGLHSLRREKRIAVQSRFVSNMLTDQRLNMLLARGGNHFENLAAAFQRGPNRLFSLRGSRSHALRRGSPFACDAVSDYDQLLS